MAIFGIGAYYDKDMSQEFIDNSIAGPGWDESEAPELFQYIASLKVGDIVYIKSCPPSSKDIHVKGIGFIADHKLLTNVEDTKDLVSAGRRVNWINTEKFKIPKPQEKNNVRLNTMYEEFHPKVQQAIMLKVVGTIKNT
jgi:hypothetical protein